MGMVEELSPVDEDSPSRSRTVPSSPLSRRVDRERDGEARPKIKEAASDREKTGCGGGGCGAKRFCADSDDSRDVRGRKFWTIAALVMVVVSVAVAVTVALVLKSKRGNSDDIAYSSALENSEQGAQSSKTAGAPDVPDVMAVFAETPTVTPTLAPTETPTAAPTAVPTSHPTTGCPDGYFEDIADRDCRPIRVTLTSPNHGSFFGAGGTGLAQAEGYVSMHPLSDVSLTLNGDPTTIQSDGTFSAALLLDADDVFNQVRAEITHIPTGRRYRDRRIAIVGKSAPFGGVLPRSIGVRIEESGFDAMEPLINRILAESLDVSNLIPSGTKLLSDQCFQDSFLGCVARGDVTVTSFSTDGFRVDLDPYGEDAFQIKIIVEKVQVDIEADTNLVDCDLRVTADTASVTAEFSFEPDSDDPTNIDVSLREKPQVSFIQFTESITGGTVWVCDILKSFGVLDGIESQAKTALQNLATDAAIDVEIEQTLQQLEIIDPIFSSLGMISAAAFFEVAEDASGVTLGSNLVLSTLSPDPDSPRVSQTLCVPETFPSPFPRQASGGPYDLALMLSFSAINQFLAGLTEQGTFRASISEVEYMDVTAKLTPLLLSGFFPQFSALDPALPLELRIAPTLPPAVTGREGPLGETAEIIFPHILADVVSAGGDGTKNDTLLARIALDATAALNFSPSADGGVSMKLTPPSTSDLRLTLLDNPLGIDEDDVRSKLPPLLEALAPLLLDSFPSFRVPAIFDFEPVVLDVSRIDGGFVGAFVDF